MRADKEFLAGNLYIVLKEEVLLSATSLVLIHLHNATVDAIDKIQTHYILLAFGEVFHLATLYLAEAKHNNHRDVDNNISRKVAPIL